MMRLLTTTAIALLLFACVSYGQSTSFSYQGSLDSAGTPANGNHDFDFLLFDSAQGGTQIGTTVSVSSVNVSGGLFSVELNFGNQFPGSDRFLEVRVRTSGTGGMTILAPRTRLVSVPYAVKSTNATNAVVSTNALQLGGVDAGQFVQTTDPRLADARNPLPNSANYIQNSTAQQAVSNFNISGNGTAGGTLRANFVSANTHFNIGNSRILGGDITDRNLYTGFGAGLSNTDGDFNSFFGMLAGDFNTTGSFNSFFGAEAGGSNDTGDDNSFFGAGAGNANNASGNSFFGSFAGVVNETGTLNSFFGSFSGDSNLSGASNSFFGASSGGVNDLGNENSFFGAFAGRDNLSASSNSFFGYRSGQMNTTGEFNTFVGWNAGKSNSNGAVNVFVGTESGAGNTSGGANVFVGSNAGDANTTGASNTFIGRDAGDTNTTGGNNSTFGRGSDVGSGALSFGTAIGSNAVVTTSNTIQLGRNGVDMVRIGTLGPGGATSLCINGGNDIASCSSSARYKSNIEPFLSGLDLVKRLQPVSFNWRDGGTPDFGLVAEEVAEVEPLLTTTNKDGEVEGVKYDRVGVVLVNAVNEQQSQIEELKEKVKREKEKSEALAERVKALEAIVCEIKPEAGACSKLITEN